MSKGNILLLLKKIKDERLKTMKKKIIIKQEKSPIEKYYMN